MRAKVGENGILVDGLAARQAVAAILRDQADAQGRGIRGRADLGPATVDDDLPRRLAPPGSEQRHRGLDRARSEQAEQADDLAMPDGEVELADHFASAGVEDREAARFEGHLAGGPAGSRAGDLTARADHLVDHRIARRLGRHERSAHPPVAHDHDAVGDLEDLGKAVRHEDDGNAAGP